VERRFRGANYHITVTNPQGVSWGVQAVRLDGEQMTGNVEPVFEDSGKHRVDVVMG